MIQVRQEQESFILAAVALGDEKATWDSLEELQDLAETSGAAVAGRILQNRSAFDPATYVGSGKIEEIRTMLERTGATGVLCDDELSPAQIANLSELLHTKVIDRTLVILDIFARRASSAEGKAQVELAQQRYNLTHLSGLGRSLSRLGGGIGTRGPGEKKLEMDRRRIRSRISQLKREIREIQQHRQVTRENRQRSSTRQAAVVGYTNAGKSTLLNRLTGAGVLEEDRLFATLDPTTRLLQLDGGQEILLTDTVGFISKLPHHLIEAFRSTLEEAKYADYIIHVVDASSPQMEEHIRIVYETLEQLKIGRHKVITLLNKMDLVDGPLYYRDHHAVKTIRTSIRNEEGIELVKQALMELLIEESVYLEHCYPYELAGCIQMIRKYGNLLAEEYTPEGIRIRAYVPREIYRKVIPKRDSFRK
jgi:GTP-binding protein HflX